MLAKARALRGELTPLTAGTPPADENFGISAAAVTALGARVATYEAEMGRPSDARSDQKAMTAQLRPRYAALRALLADIDGLMPMLRDRGEAHTLFVDPTSTRAASAGMLARRTRAATATLAGEAADELGRRGPRLQSFRGCELSRDIALLGACDLPRALLSSVLDVGPRVRCGGVAA